MYEAFVSLYSPSLCLWLRIHICLSSGTVTQIPARMCLSGYVTDYCLAQDCVCMTVCRVCVCVCSCVCVCECVSGCTACAPVPIKLFAFDALSCGLQAASLMHSPLLPAMLWPL